MYDDGDDFPISHPNIVWDRYNPRIAHEDIVGDQGQITDSSANKTNMQAVLTGFQTGSNGFPKLNPEDFLLVFIYGHGDTDIIDLKTGNPDDNISSEELHNWLNPLICKTKIFVNTKTEKLLTFSF